MENSGERGWVKKHWCGEVDGGGGRRNGLGTVRWPQQHRKEIGY